MTAKQVAHYLARTLQQQHPTLIQHYAVSHLEYTLHRALNAITVESKDQSSEESVGANGSL